tara:strand:- start:49 stop:588 length:540 start_codon:yes stop_codon:yes gene_type:complete
MKTGIEKFKDVIDSETCDLLTTYIENNLDQFEDMQYTKTQSVICKEYLLDNGCELDDAVYKVVNKVALMYKEKYPYFVAGGDTGYQLRKITGATRQHTDFDHGAGDCRTISIILGLNSNYEKGEFHFPYQDFSTTVKRGEAIVFPVYFMYPHFVDAPIGYRYTVNTWITASSVHPNQDA